MENFTALPCITTVVYLLAELFKQVTKGKFNRFLPLFCGILGGIMGAVGFFVAPKYIVADNIFCALGIGIVSGFSATGVNQIYKQLSASENGENNNDE